MCVRIFWGCSMSWYLLPLNGWRSLKPGGQGWYPKSLSTVCVSGYSKASPCAGIPDLWTAEQVYTLEAEADILKACLCVLGCSAAGPTWADIHDPLNGWRSLQPGGQGWYPKSLSMCVRIFRGWSMSLYPRPLNGWRSLQLGGRGWYP